MKKNDTDDQETEAPCLSGLPARTCPLPAAVASMPHMGGAYAAAAGGEQDPEDELSKMLHAAPELAPPGKTLAPSTPPRPAAAAVKEPWMWEDSEGSREKLSRLFVMIDRDTPGEMGYDAVGSMKHAKQEEADDNEASGISSTELEHMLLNLGEDINETFADEMVDLVDYSGDGQVDFMEFYAVMTGATPLDGLPRNAQSPGTRSRNLKPGRSVRQIRQQFDEIDEDGGGTLDKEEVSKLAVKMGNGLNRRHLVDAMIAMGK